MATAQTTEIPVAELEREIERIQFWFIPGERFGWECIATHKAKGIVRSDNERRAMLERLVRTGIIVAIPTVFINPKNPSYQVKGHVYQVASWTPHLKP